MQLIQAKCINPAWDSARAKYFYAGEMYEIDRDSPLAELKIGSGPNARYVFEFDRNSPGEKHDYTCKECGFPAKTLAELGRHCHVEHPLDTGIPEPQSEPEEVFADRTCPECQRKCASPYGLRVHRNKSHGVPMKEAQTETAAA